MTDQRTREIVDGLGEAAAGEADRRASQEIVGALRAHREQVSGSAAVPADDPQLSSKVMAEARNRSQEIRQGAAKRTDHPIPWWLWLAWVAAIAVLVFLWFRLK